MAKRRAEETLLPEFLSKRCYRSLCTVDAQGESKAPAAAVSPPSLLALLGTRCRKRPYYFDDREKGEETAPHRKATHCDARKHAVNVLGLQTSGSFQHRRSSGTVASSQKRLREDSVGSDTAVPKLNDKADGETNTEDCTFNSFQYWRVPLPELDLSLLEDANLHSKAKEKLKDPSSDVMET